MSKNVIRLSEASVGKEYVIERVEGHGLFKRRLLDMGLVPGEKVKVVRVAPLGDPIDLVTRGFDVSVRKSEASLVWVRGVEG